MKTFSERMGFKSVSTVIQVEGMNDELRNSLWNALDVFFWRLDNFLYTQYDKPIINNFSSTLWMYFFKKPIDTRPREYDGTLSSQKTLNKIRDFFFTCEWCEVYDFLEFVISNFDNDKFWNFINFILERELAGYRVIDKKFVPITNEQEVKMLEEALQDTRYEGVTAHLKRSLELLSDRKNPDYRNSLKESISAVESIARIIAGNDKATLGQALKVLEKDGKLHSALKNGFSNLYGYTNDEEGVRHAMMEEPKLDAADAKFFLLSCTSFVNYLKSKI